MAVECPFCHYRFVETVIRLLTGHSLCCPACKKVLDYALDDLHAATQREAERAPAPAEPFRALTWRRT